MSPRVRRDAGTVLRRLWGGHLRPVVASHQLLFLRFAAAVVGQSAASLAMILLVKEFLAGALGEAGGPGRWIAARVGEAEMVVLTAMLLLASFVVESLLRYDSVVTQQRIVKVVEVGLMERLIRHLLTLSIPFFDGSTTGDLVQAVRLDVAELRQLLTSLAHLVLETCMVVGLVIGAFLVAPGLSLWGLVFLPLVLLPIVLVGKRTRTRSMEVREAGVTVLDVVLEIVAGIRVVKVFRMEALQTRISAERARRHFDTLIDIVRTRARADLLLQSAAGLGTAAILLMGGLRVLEGAMGWPAFLAFVLAFRTLHGPLDNMTRHYVNAESRAAAVVRIDELLQRRPEVVEAADPVPLTGPPRVLALHGVGLRLGGRTQLERVSFTVREGETIGIVGPSGAGKTSLLNLLLRLYDPTSGRIEVDGVDLRKIRVADLYEQVAIVPQQPFLFATSVRENIRCGRPTATDDEVREAARAARIDTVIEGLPDGYDTVIGLGGEALSTGQAQRITIARALLRNAPVLLLDEATSALDSVAEAAIHEAIDRRMEGRTLFVVAHRLSTLRRADRIVVLEAGRMVGWGTHEDLLAGCPVYRESWTSQRLDSESRELPAAEEPRSPVEVGEASR